MYSMYVTGACAPIPRNRKREPERGAEELIFREGRTKRREGGRDGQTLGGWGGTDGLRGQRRRLRDDRAVGDASGSRSRRQGTRAKRGYAQHRVAALRKEYVSPLSLGPCRIRAMEAAARDHGSRRQGVGCLRYSASYWLRRKRRNPRCASLHRGAI